MIIKSIVRENCVLVGGDYNPVLAILFGAKAESRAQKRQSTLIKDLKIEIRTVFQNVTRRSTSVLLYWSPSINKALYEYCVTTSHKRGGATRQCKCVRGGKTSKETFIDFSVIFLLLLYVVLCYTSPPERLFLCVSYFYAFFAAFVIASGAPRRRTSENKCEITYPRVFAPDNRKKVAASAVVGIECRGVVT